MADSKAGDPISISGQELDESLKASGPEDRKDEERRGERNHPPSAEITTPSSELQIKSVTEKEDETDQVRVLERQLEVERKKSQDLTSRMKYLQADIINLQKQSDRMLIDVRNQARFTLLLELISVKEDLGRAIEASASPQPESLVDGLRLLRARIESTLKSEDVSDIAPKPGDKLDPRLHEAVMSRSTREYEEGSVVSLIRPGYSVAGKVVRPALIEVARKSEIEDAKGQKPATTDSEGMGLDASRGAAHKSQANGEEN